METIARQKTRAMVFVFCEKLKLFKRLSKAGKLKVFPPERSITSGKIKASPKNSNPPIKSENRAMSRNLNL